MTIQGVELKSSHVEAETLWRHVIDRAIRDALSTNPKIVKELKLWMLSPDFSFVCDCASVSPDKLREELVLVIKPASRGAARYTARRLRRAVLQRRRGDYDLVDFD